MIRTNLLTCRVCDGPITKLSEMNRFPWEGREEYEHAHAFDCVAFTKKRLVALERAFGQRGHGYAEIGDTIVLAMTRDDYHRLLIIMGYAAGGDAVNRWKITGLLNRLNVGNAMFTPYEIPEEFR